MIIDVRTEGKPQFGGPMFSMIAAVRNHVCKMQYGDVLIVDRFIDAMGDDIPLRNIQIQSHIASMTSRTRVRTSILKNGSLRIVRGEGKVEKRKNQKWPFKDMKVGDTVEFAAPNDHARMNAHNYGSGKGWAFKSKTVDGVIRITRLA